MYLNDTDSGSGGGFGHDFISALETTLQISVTVGTSTITFTLGSDTSEPYLWVPTNGQDVEDFVEDLTPGLHNTTLKFINPL